MISVKVTSCLYTDHRWCHLSYPPLVKVIVSYKLTCRDEISTTLLLNGYENFTIMFKFIIKKNSW